MAIPEAQLETWAHQGSVPQSSTTYNRIRNVLLASNTPYAGKKVNVFLQGSYGNATNIYAESDVDIVCKLGDCFFSDLSQLSESARTALNRTFSTATYTHVDFKRDVLRVLSDAYGADVKAGNKAIEIAAGGGRRKADVIVAIQYRRYIRFDGAKQDDFIDGICFFDNFGTMIANYPEQHSDNLTLKHQATKHWLKPTIRIMKNVRSKLADKGQIQSKIAPSYFIEGLLYNVPKDKYGSTYQDWFVNFNRIGCKPRPTRKSSCALTNSTTCSVITTTTAGLAAITRCSSGPPIRCGKTGNPRMAQDLNEAIRSHASKGRGHRASRSRWSRASPANDGSKRLGSFA